MKVLMINGSPHEHGCTYIGLQEVEKTLQKHDIETEIFWLGNKPVYTCIACGKCAKTGTCVFTDDVVNQVVDKINAGMDGLVIGSPVHFASATGIVTAVMDRVFCCVKKTVQKKVGAAVVSCRRGGAATTFDQLNKYFSITNMPIVPSLYWNQIHGNTPEEAKQDLEGMQTMRILGENMAWLMTCLAICGKAGVPEPQYEDKIMTNFIR